MCRVPTRTPRTRAAAAPRSQARGPDRVRAPLSLRQPARRAKEAPTQEPAAAFGAAGRAKGASQPRASPPPPRLPDVPVLPVGVGEPGANALMHSAAMHAVQARNFWDKVNKGGGRG